MRGRYRNVPTAELRCQLRKFTVSAGAADQECLYYFFMVVVVVIIWYKTTATAC
jgi:hypothetical protein